VSESGFYAWRSRPPSVRAIRHAWLTDLIVRVHVDFRGVYGYRRVHAELTLGHGLTVGAEAVWLLMRKAGLQGLSGRPKYRRIPNQPTAGDHVERDFSRSEADRLWVTDITEHPTREGKVYCAVVLDAFSRRVVGWSIDASPTAALVTNALGMAIQTRTPPAGAIIHSDQGVQPRFKGSSQHRLGDRSIGGHRGPLLGFSIRGSCGVGG
jgi:putative transposase